MTMSSGLFHVTAAVGCLFLTVLWLELSGLMLLFLDADRGPQGAGEIRKHRIFPGVTAAVTRTSQWMVRAHDRVFRGTFGLIFLGSVLLTSIAILTGRLLEQDAAAGEAIARTLPSLLPFSGHFYRTEFLYPFNYLFDALAVRVMIGCAGRLARPDKGAVAGFFTMAVNLCFAGLFAFITMFGIKALSSYNRAEAYTFTMIPEDLARTADTWRAFFSAFTGDGFHRALDWDSFFFSITTLAPSLFFLTAVVVFVTLSLMRHLTARLGWGRNRRPGSESPFPGHPGFENVPHSDPWPASENPAPAGSSPDQPARRRPAWVLWKPIALIADFIAILLRCFYRVLRKIGFRRLGLAGFAMVFLAAAGFGWLYLTLPGVDSLQTITSHSSITIDKTGDNIQFIDIKKSLPVAYDSLPPHLTDALLTMEDRRFMDHPGFDLPGMARAAVKMAFTGRLQGGSSITQQLAKNMMLSGDRTLLRKARELVLAIKIEQRYTKPEILEMYLNQIYLGRNCYGIETAARMHFDKRAKDLNLYESCMIVGSIPSPARRNYSDHPDTAKERADLVLNSLVAQGHITAEDARQARRIGVRKGGRQLRSIEHRYFFDWIRPQIQKVCKGIDGTLTVITTLNPEIQLYGEFTVKNRIRYGSISGDTQTALLSMAPDGAVRAMIGGRDYAKSQYNRAVQARRQPGSLFKAFVYLAALEDGRDPEEPWVYDFSPIDGWPRNWDDRYYGYMSMIQALKTSRNAAAVWMAREVGLDRVTETAARLGIGTKMKEEPALALGTNEVTMMDITRAYAAFANGGRKVTPYGILLIRNRRGDIVYRHAAPAGKRVVQEDHLKDMNRMLSAVLTEGGTGERAVFTGHPDIAGKSGTTQDNRDAWFLGYSAHLVTAVWFGHDNPAPMPNISGSGAPALVWRDFNRSVHQYMGLPDMPLPASGKEKPKSIPADVRLANR